MKTDSNAVQALNIAFYILTEILEQDGLLSQERLAASLDRVEISDKPVIVENLQAMADALRSRQFGPTRLSVIAGGAD